MRKYVFFFFLMSISLNSFTQNFTKEVVSSMGPGTSVGSYCNLAISNDNLIHFCHFDFLNKDLLYTTNAGGSWQTTIVDSSGQVGEFCSIAVDGNNYAHISYFEFLRNDSIGGGAIPYGNLKYATNNNGQWENIVIDTASGLLTRICVDNQNFVHIVHTELGITDPINNLLNIKYATNKSGIWQSTAIAPGVVKGADGSIAVDDNQNIHIAIRNEEGVGISPDGGMGGLRYITGQTGNWTWSDVDTNYYSGNDVDIAVDAQNNPHISYLDKTKGLKYATILSGDWNYNILDSSHNVGWNTSLIIDNNNHIHISYSDPSPLIDTTGNGYLKYISNSTGNWTIQIIDSADAGMYTGIALDTLFLPHFAYTALNMVNGSGILKHAYQSITTGWDVLHNEDTNITVFPNPANEILNVQISSFTKETHLNIYNLNGVLQKTTPVFKNNLKIDILDLPSGMYFLSLTDNSSYQTFLNFIKL